MTVSSTLTFESPLRLPEYQNEYGQGWNGQYSYLDGKGGGTYDDYDESWGPRLDMGLDDPAVLQRRRRGTLGVPPRQRPELLRDGRHLGDERRPQHGLREGQRPPVDRELRSERDAPVVPAQTEDHRRRTPPERCRTSSRRRSRSNTSTSTARIARGRATAPTTRCSGSCGAAGRSIPGFSRGVSTTPTAHSSTGTTGGTTTRTGSRGVNQNWDSRDRVIGTGSVTYQVNPWLSTTVRSGTDWYQDNRKRIFAAGTLGQSGVDPNGAFGEGNVVPAGDQLRLPPHRHPRAEG